MRPLLYALLLLACGESPRSYAVQHDVGRLCAAWDRCEGGFCEAYGDERGRMQSTWGVAIQPRLADGEQAALTELSAMVDASGAGSMSPTCRALRDAVR
ncbi:MAG: hypothetical protein EP330_11215 [Deltaproteobacteria bacterium]|nr:MAG: hypothetical protein EP330_11215 [Deltaproteobacteria bacterium]